MTGNTGTLRYMAPEVAVGKPYNNTVDTYSFGIIVWQMLKGQVPFQGMGRKTFMERVVSAGERPKLSRHWPARFSDLLQRCWSEDKSVRPNFFEIVQELDSLIIEVEQSPSYRMAQFLSNFCVPSIETTRYLFFVSLLAVVISLGCTLGLRSEISGLSATIVSSFLVFVSGTTCFRSDMRGRVPSHDAETAVVSGVQMSFNPLQLGRGGGGKGVPAKLHGIDS